MAKRKMSSSKMVPDHRLLTEGAENGLEFTIVKPFNWIGPRMDFIPGIDGPSEGVPRVLACFSNNLLRREPLKLVDGGQSQRTFVYIKDVIKAVMLMIVMAEYHNRLREAERCKVKLKENKQLMNDARKMSKALAEAIQVKDQHFESLKRRNCENLRLKVQFEATKKQLETTMLKVSKVKGELDSALVEVSELKSSIPTEKEAAMKEFLGSHAFLHVLRPRCTWEVHFEKRKWMAVIDRYDDGSVVQKYREEIDEHHRKGETFDLAVYSSNVDESGDKASADEQSYQGDDEFGDAENGGRTQSDMIRGSTSDEDD
ncbi:hypothetical protein DVH24_038978 [Malus domestica]|uniref:NAD-dependent epimerase/dehydratase domain-containing protein n=1 Tax=Malus domestica TaxID=3750 RepID=A0A498KE85_MALDO|nr:hypothetical protein DVH24_038978 [Malus domestica]